MLAAAVLVVIPPVSLVVLAELVEVMEDLLIQLQELDMERQVLITLVAAVVADQELHQIATVAMVDLVLSLFDIKSKYLKKLYGTTSFTRKRTFFI
tara:strand:+ start:139 stop:426 length:288 start_codon:yes stop_codon:yes gene_type:complete